MNKKPTLNQMITRLRYFIKHMNYTKALQQTQAIQKNLQIAIIFQQQRKQTQNNTIVLTRGSIKEPIDKGVLDAYNT